MIKAEALTRTYGDFVAVNKVSFEIGPQEIVGLLGHNGAGKTTIMKMMTGFLEPTAGTISVNGLNAFSDRLQIQGHIGYLPENCPVYPEMTVLDYLDYAASLRGVPDERKVERVGYAVEKTKLARVINQTINTLSRGYRQRVGVAQAILNSPSIIILDEPTNGLDPSQILEMRHLIQELSQTATIVISTHILQEVQAVCGRVIIINNGKLALDEQLGSLQAATKLLLVVDKQCDFSETDDSFTVASRMEKNGCHHYSLEIKGARTAHEAAPLLVKRLVEQGFNIYSIQPLVRDLETIFGEITAGNDPAAGANDEQGPTEPVSAITSGTVDALPASPISGK